MDERVVLGDAFGLAEVGAGVGPFLTQGPVEPFDFAVGLWPVRPIDGVVAAQWMAAFISLLEQPVRILFE